MEIPASFLNAFAACAVLGQAVFGQSKPWMELGPSMETEITAMTSTRAGTLLAGNSQGSIYRSTDGGDHWSYVHGMAGSVRAFNNEGPYLIAAAHPDRTVGDCFCPSQPAWQSTLPNRTGLAYSRNDGATWIPLPIKGAQAIAYSWRTGNFFVADDEGIAVCDSATMTCAQKIIDPNLDVDEDPAGGLEWLTLDCIFDNAYGSVTGSNHRKRFDFKSKTLTATELAGPVFRCDREVLPGEPRGLVKLDIATTLIATDKGIFRRTPFILLSTPLSPTVLRSMSGSRAFLCGYSASGNLQTSRNGGSTWINWNLTAAYQQKWIWGDSGVVFTEINGTFRRAKEVDGWASVSASIGMGGVADPEVTAARGHIVLASRFLAPMYRTLQSAAWKTIPNPNGYGWNATANGGSFYFNTGKSLLIGPDPSRMSLRADFDSGSIFTVPGIAAGRGFVAAALEKSLPFPFSSASVGTVGFSAAICRDGETTCLVSPDTVIGVYRYIASWVDPFLHIAAGGDTVAVAFHELHFSPDAGKTWTPQRSLGGKVPAKFDFLQGRLIGAFTGTEGCKPFCLQATGDLGQTWTKLAVTGLRGKEIKTLVSGGGHLFAGTDSGAFISADAAEWRDLGPGPVAREIRSLSLDGRLLVAATEDGAVLALDLDEGTVATKTPGAPARKSKAQGQSLWKRYTDPSGGARTLNGRAFGR